MAVQYVSDNISITCFIENSQFMITEKPDVTENRPLLILTEKKKKIFPSFWVGLFSVCLPGCYQTLQKL